MVDDLSVSIYPKSQKKLYIIIVVIVVIIVIIAFSLLSLLHDSSPLNYARIQPPVFPNSNSTMLAMNITYIGKVAKVNGDQFTIANGSDSKIFTADEQTVVGTLPSSKQLNLLNAAQDLHSGDYIQVVALTKGNMHDKVYGIFKLTPDYFNYLRSTQ